VFIEISATGEAWIMKHFTQTVVMMFMLGVYGAGMVYAGDEPGERMLRVVIGNDIRSTNPGVDRDADTDMVLHHIVESLVAFREDLSVAPLVADRYDISEDGLVYTFHLRPGLTFHNGAPVTAQDVKWSWQRYLDPQTRWKCRNWYVSGEDEQALGRERSVIQSIETPDELTVVFRLRYPSALFLDRMANVQCITAVLHRDSVNPDGTWNKPIGTGPFRLKEWQHGEYVELERFEGYRPRAGQRDGFVGRKEAFANRIRFMVTPDPASVKAALASGELDIYPRLLMNAVQEMQSEPEVVLEESPTLVWSVLLFQTRDKVFRDVRIRRAVAHAINRKELSGFTTYGFADVNSSFVPVADPRHTALHDQWLDYDPQKARALLREAGYRGEVITIQANRKYPNMYENALVIQAMLQNVGLNVRLRVMDWATQLGNYYSGDFQMMTFSFSALSNPLFRLAKLIGDKDMGGTFQWESAEASRLLQVLSATRERKRQQEYLDRLFELFKQDVPLLGLYNPRAVIALRKDIQGFKPWVMRKARLWGVWKKDWNIGMGSVRTGQE
tara:strand:+ start:4816 stop:6486 length:1671 start_codon:yes stop_codon:yes gene_type:complete